MLGLVAALGGCSVPELIERPVDAAVDRPADDAPSSATPSCPDPVERGCERVRIAGGGFEQGSDDLADSRPVLPGVRVSDFTLDATEVTVARLRRFRDDLARWTAALPVPAEIRVRYPGGVEVVVPTAGLDPERIQNPMEGIGVNRVDDPRAGVSSHPANGVTWAVAMAFCAWDGGRLPTEAEWEYAARWWRSERPGGRTYPWGEESPARRCDLAHWMIGVFTPNGLCVGADKRASRRVASLPLGQIHGLHDLAGNAVEWLADRYVPYGQPCAGRGAVDPLCDADGARDRVMRGGSARTLATASYELRSAWRARTNPSLQDSAYGFRCAR
ncbi:MAG: SUMF1/EgtB/PvdO family nonheme iron enzyme [Deltaproteobacteria bacterium]|nr:SUMF1/EgtB/PvdO family nonheme iron enzyme [Myxococcales bacterium]MDP3221360.1 SUMF1/EgtB/PvdO family nonheme iron enzyme [Deltaproteobacteria bacterium]